MKDKKTLWRGLSSVFALLAATSLVCTDLLFLYKGNVDLVLGTTPEVSTAEGDTNYFPSSYGELSAENLKKLKADEKAFNVQVSEEGSVLVKNNGALPLRENERSVTLFGRSTADPLYRGASGGSGFSTKSGITLYDAFKNAGFSINDTLFNAYKTSSTKRTTAEWTGASIGEEAPSFYTDELKASYAEKYNDVAVVMFTRVSGEGNDMNVVDADGVPELSLHESEAALLKMIKESGKFKKTIVLINSGNAMDLGFAEQEEYGVDACLWIGLPGNHGFEGVVNVLTGKSDVTGRFVDTYATDSLSSPAMQNVGHNYYTNMTSKYQKEYVVYAEDIYVGYKYYETRYYDQVMGLHNAASSAGVFASDTTWNYAEEMAYPFGYGLSYSAFTQEVESIEWNRSTHKVTANVKVTNLGGENYDGESKSVVELYVNVPYIEGGVEKSAIQLIGFGKTDSLKKGESQTVTVETDDYLFASYDRTATNGADPAKKGCYIFDKGDYTFAIGADAHDALNNVLAEQGASGMFDIFGNPVSGNENNAVTITLDAYDNTTYAVSPHTGEVVCNQFDDADINYFGEGTVQYLTRKDWKTFPTTAVLTATEEMKRALDANTYQKPADAPEASSFTSSAKNNLMLVDMREVPYEDEETWNRFLDQFTIRELVVNTADQLGSDAVTSVGKKKAASTDGPDGIAGTYKIGEADTGTCFGCEVLLTSTWNLELSALRGKYMAEDAQYLGVTWVWGPGADLHRTPYGGRNFEYYSEDGNMAYLFAKPQLGAMMKGGLITGLKHFALNDQETDRHGISTFITEQALRENNLRAFEGGLAEGNTLGVMSAFNRIGCVPTMQSYSLLTQVLRNEWGFQGVCITDASQDGADYMRTLEGATAGSDVWCMDQTRTETLFNAAKRDANGDIVRALRRANKNFMYALSRSNLINGLTSETAITQTVSWWQPAVIVLDCVLGAAAIAFTALAVVDVLKKKKED